MPTVYTEVTAGLAKLMAALPPGGCLKVTCGLTACTPRSTADLTLGNEYRITLPLPFTSASAEFSLSLGLSVN